MKIKLITTISTIFFSGSILVGGILLYNNANIDKLSLLNRAVEDDTLHALKQTRGDIQLSLGYEYSGAIVDGELYMWGINNYGQLGLGNKIDRDTPTQVKITGTITQLALGDYHAGAVIDDNLYMWGQNQHGQLGLGNNINQDTPTQVTNIPNGTINKLSLGTYFSGAIIDHELYMWGINNGGQIGLGSSGGSYSTPQKITIPGAVTELKLCWEFVGAVADNKLYMWGANGYGQLGLGHNNNRSIPSLVTDLPAGTLSKFQLGNYNGGILVNGELYMWGSNYYGQIDSGNNGNREIPIKINTPGIVSEYAIGSGFVAVIIDQKIYTWGFNNVGQLGLGNTTNQKNPTEVKINGIATEIILSDSCSGAIIDGQMYLWGKNNRGQLGLGDMGDDKNRLSPTLVTITKSMNIILNNLNDSTNLREDIAYNIDENNIKNLIEQSRSEIGLTSNQYTISNLNYIGTSEPSKSGQISFTITSPMKIFNVTFDGFKAVNETQNATIEQKIIPTNDKTFEGFEINQLVAQANANATGSNHILSSWIIDNQNLFLGSANSTNTVDFPQNTKITKVDNFAVVSGVDGTISFNIYVDKYYKKSASGLILSTPTDPVIKLNNKLNLTGFDKTKESRISQIEVLDSNITGINLLNNSFGYVNDTTPITSHGMIELKKYLDLTSFPSDIAVKIINPIIGESSLSFKLNIDKYYDENGILQNTAKTFDQLITINNLLNSTSTPKLLLDFKKMPPNFILTYLDYNGHDGTVNNTKLKEYFDLSSFPNNAVFTLTNVSQTENSLTISIVTSTWYNANGIVQISTKTYDPIIINDLPLNPTTDIKLKATYNKDILAGDLAKTFKLSTDNGGSFDKTVVEQYVDFLAVEPSATYTIKDLVNINGILSFTIIASQAYDNGLVVNNKEFNIEISNLITIKDSSDIDFVKKNINGDGAKLSKEIEQQLKIGTVIDSSSPAYALWNQLVNIDVYPPNTNFKINNITTNNMNIFSTFQIDYTASSYYENNTTMNARKSGVININNLKFMATNISLKTDFPKDINVGEFFNYIEYDELTGIFNVNKLEQFVNLNGFDLSEPGVSVKMLNAKEEIDKNAVSFGLQVPYFIGNDGNLVNETKIYNFTLNFSNNDFSWIIIWSAIGGAVLIVFFITLANRIIKNKRDKINNSKTDDNDAQ